MSTSDRSSVLVLENLESDPTPTFVIKIGVTAIEFEILFCNEAFRKGGFRERVFAANRSALLFRSWAQAVALFQKTYILENWLWTAEVAGRDGNWKVVKGTNLILNEQLIRGNVNEDTSTIAMGTQRNVKRPRSDSAEEMREVRRPLLPLFPRTNLTARWESIQTMMEMSDVGVFEFEPNGRLSQANEAWYKLSSHPRDLPAHTDFSFMDLVYPEDQALVMSMWNSLIQGKSVTFEMRWKANKSSTDAAQWVLSACLPVLDEDGKLLAIAGNTIDINAQKKSQEAAVAQVEALESARLSERKFTRFAQLAPIAIYIFVPGKGMQYVNDQFFELTGHPRVDCEQLDWSQLVAEEDLDKAQTMWSGILDGKKTEHTQFRLKKTWINQEGIRSNIWVQGSSYPELGDHGNVISIMGTLFDISHFKWAESVQCRLIEEALEAKRQQENFIDMTSHELRNPLSAIIQCADSVIATLQHLTPRNMENEKFDREVATSIDSLQTIVSCSLHQKRIIDDLLTLSKLDSNLILITPMRVQPVAVISASLKMFDIECRQSQISLDFKRDDETLKGLEWVMLDPSRLLQILINLVTNAIKFTKDRPERKVTVTLGGCWEPPPAVWQSINFTSAEDSKGDLLSKPEWGNGRRGFIWLKVEDTGCGMTVDEQKKLFSRFSQATPRTHVKYGGSGLGLFISKSLATLQGGAIGVRSDPNVGSTFAFYVGTRTTHAFADPADHRSYIQPQSIASMEEAMKEARLSILIVEDNLVNQTVLSKQLQKAGCNVSVAGNGVEALDWLRRSEHWQGEQPEVSDGDRTSTDPARPESKHKVDIILMDIEMPVMDGLTCAQLIRDYERQGLLTPLASRARPRRLSTSFTAVDLHGTSWLDQKRWLPILAVSANARSEQIQQALAAGMDDTVAKPFRIPELWPKMERLIEQASLL